MKTVTAALHSRKVPHSGNLARLTWTVALLFCELEKGGIVGDLLLILHIYVSYLHSLKGPVARAGFGF